MKDDATLEKDKLLVLIEKKEKFLDPPPFIEPHLKREFLFPVLKNMVRNGKRYDTNKDNVINEIVHFLFGMESRPQGLAYRSNVVSFDSDMKKYDRKSTEYFQVLYPDIDMDSLVGLGQRMWNGYLGHDLYSLVKWADIEVHQKNGDTRIGGNGYFIHNTRQLDTALTVMADEMSLTDIILSDTIESIINVDLNSYDKLRMEHSDMVRISKKIDLKDSERIKLTYHRGKNGEKKYIKRELSKNDLVLRNGRTIRRLEDDLADLQHKTEDQDSYYNLLYYVLKERLPDKDEDYIQELILHNRFLTGTKGRKVTSKNKVEFYRKDMKAIFDYATKRYDEKNHKFHHAYKDILIAKYADLIDNTLFYPELAEPKQHDRAMKNMVFLEEAKQFFYHIADKGEEIPLEILWLHDKLLTQSTKLATSLGYTFHEHTQMADEYIRKAEQFEDMSDFFRGEHQILSSIFSQDQRLKASDKFKTNPSGGAR